MVIVDFRGTRPRLAGSAAGTYARLHRLQVHPGGPGNRGDPDRHPSPFEVGAVNPGHGRRRAIVGGGVQRRAVAQGARLKPALPSQ